MILIPPGTLSQLEDKTLFLDTNIFIAAQKNPEIAELIFNIRQQGCELMIIPSVAFEFTRGTGTIADFEKRANLLQKNTIIYPIDRHLKELKEFTLVYQKNAGRASYTDFLLAACLYKFQSAFVLTENHTDFPTTILDRVSIITLDTGREIRNLAIYSFSKLKFNKAAEKILKQ